MKYIPASKTTVLIVLLISILLGIIFLRSNLSHFAGISSAFQKPLKLLTPTKNNPFSCETLPYSGSPLCSKHHPRLHIIPGDDPEIDRSIGYYREKVSRSRDQGGFKEEYQGLVDHLVEQFGKNENDTPLEADYHALVCLLNVSDQVIDYHGKTIDSFCREGVRTMMAKIDEPLPRKYEKAGHDIHDPFSTVARAYDWLYHRLTQNQRTHIAHWLAKVGHKMYEGEYSGKGIKNGRPRSLWSSNYFEIVQPYYIGLAFYNDGIDDQMAQTLVSSFESLMLDGKWLDAQNFVARSHGGPSEVGGYGFGHARRHILNIDAWKTATGKNYFAEGTSLVGAYYIKNHPQFVQYLVKPGDSNYLIRWGEGVSAGFKWGGNTLRMLGEPLKTADSDMAQLNRWLLDRPEAARGFSTGPEENFFDVLLGDRGVDAASPSQIKLPLTRLFEGLGMAIMRTGFLENADDMVFAVGAPQYQYRGHTWATSGGGYMAAGIPLGFTIDRFGGPLIVVKKGRHRGCESEGCAYHNIMRFNDPDETDDLSGGFYHRYSGSNIREFTPDNSRVYRGGITRMETVEDTGIYDYLYTDLERNYQQDRVLEYSRQYVYFRPETVADPDIIVIFDRTETTRPEIIKRWIINTAYEPRVTGTVNQARKGNKIYDGDLIEITNDLNQAPDPYSRKIYEKAHGRLYIRQLLPENAKISVFGGKGHEFEDDRGVNIGNKGDYKALRELGAFYLGPYRTEVIPTDKQTRHNFLHVLQIADTHKKKQSEQMVQTQRVDATTMVGAHIAPMPGQREWIALFSRTEENQTQVTYRFAAFSSTTHHWIADLEPDCDYTISRNGVQLATRKSSDAGVVYFTHDTAGNPGSSVDEFIVTRQQ